MCWCRLDGCDAPWIEQEFLHEHLRCMVPQLWPMAISCLAFLVGEPELNICVWCVCGVPWMDAML